jgi:hypothetical protein
VSAIARAESQSSSTAHHRGLSLQHRCAETRIRRSVSSRWNALCSETAEPIPAELSAGVIVVFRSWWDPDQLAIARGGRSGERRRFLPTDSIRYHPDGSEERIAGGWDHEHCRLCWETFDAETPFAYVSGDDWLCGECYDDYIAGGFGARLGDEV